MDQENHSLKQPEDSPNLPAPKSATGEPLQPKLDTVTTPYYQPKLRPPLVIGSALAVIVALTAGLAWIATSRQPAGTPSTAEPATNVIDKTGIISVGSISPDDPAGEVEEFQPFIDYVVSQLSSQGIREGEVIVASNVAEMAQLIRQGKVDIFIDSPFPTFAVDKLVETSPLVVRWKKGVEKIHSVIFVRSNSGIEDLDDLKGKLIAFEEPSSTSGYFLPRSTLERAGYTLVQQSTTAPLPEEITYLFTFDEDDILEQVRTGQVQAGGMRDKTFEELAGESIEQFKVLLTSPEVYRHIVTVRGDMDPELASALKNVLLSMHESTAGTTILKEFSKTAQFSDFPPNTSAYEGIESLVELVEEEIIRR